MKNYFKVLVAALVLSTTLFSCDSDDDKKIELKNEIKFNDNTYVITDVIAEYEEDEVLISFYTQGVKIEFDALVMDKYTETGAGNLFGLIVENDEFNFEVGDYDFIADETQLEGLYTIDLVKETEVKLFSPKSGKLKIVKSAADSKNTMTASGTIQKKVELSMQLTNVEGKVLDLYYNGKISLLISTDEDEDKEEDKKEEETKE